MAHLGNQDNFTWTCPFTKTGKKSAHSTCAKEFAKQNGFQLIETSDDGNCFFYTLTKFGKRSGYEPFELNANEYQNSMMLRNILVDHIQDNFDKYDAFLLNNNNNNNNNNQGRSKENQIIELRENGVWDASAGDLVPYAGANAFSVNINMYNIINHGENDVVHLIQIHPNRPSPIYVNIMRVREGHFQLLWPKSGIFSSNIRNLEEKEEKENSSNVGISSVDIAIEAAKVAVKAAHQAVSASTNKKNVNEKKLENITNQLNKLSIKASKSPPRSTRRSSRISTKAASPIRSARLSTLKSKVKKIVKQNNNNNMNNNLKAILEASKYNY